MTDLLIDKLTKNNWQINLFSSAQNTVIICKYSMLKYFFLLEQMLHPASWEMVVATISVAWGLRARSSVAVEQAGSWARTRGAAWVRQIFWCNPKTLKSWEGLNGCKQLVIHFSLASLTVFIIINDISVKRRCRNGMTDVMTLNGPAVAKFPWMIVCTQPSFAGHSAQKEINNLHMTDCFTVLKCLPV